MDDAFGAYEVGAQQLICLCAGVRGNRRTRVHLVAVRAEWLRQRTGGVQLAVPGWYKDVVDTAFTLYTVLRRYAYPRTSVSISRPLQQQPRATRRAVRTLGQVVVELPTLAEQAAATVTALMADLVNADVVIWIDNWYWERYLPTVDRSNRSLDVTVAAALVLKWPDRGPASGTRRQTMPVPMGHLGLSHMVMRVGTVDSMAIHAYRRLMHVVTQLRTQPLQPSELRVPLDVQRPRRRRLHWRPLTMYEDRVGSAAELLWVMQDIRELQGRVGRPVMLLVDEKVHYSIMRMLYSQPYSQYDVHRWLVQVPVLYGCWHAFKQTVVLMYRHFMPVFGLLEQTGLPVVGSTVRLRRKLLYMERLCGAMLLCTPVAVDLVLRAWEAAATDNN